MCKKWKWEVVFPCVQLDRYGIESDRHLMIGPYFVCAESEKEAEEKAELMLPEKYVPDDAAEVRPYRPRGVGISYNNAPLSEYERQHEAVIVDG